MHLRDDDVFKCFSKSKMATKKIVRGTNIKFDLQSESYRSIRAVIHFYYA